MLWLQKYKLLTVLLLVLLALGTIGGWQESLVVADGAVLCTKESPDGSSSSQTCNAISNQTDCAADPSASGCSRSPGTCTKKNCDLITNILDPAISFLAALVGVVVVISVIWGGVQYITAAGNPQAVASARKRILNAILALVVFTFLYAFLYWIIPGGIKLL